MAQGCTAALLCEVGAFTAAWASGDESRPRIEQSKGHGFSFTEGGDADVEHAYHFGDLDITCSASTGEGYGFVMYNKVDDVLLERLRTSSFSIGLYLAGSNACSPAPDYDVRSERVSLVRSEIIDSIGFGWLGAGNDMLLADNRFLRNVRGTVFDHNVYLDESSGATTGARVVRNELYRSAARDSGSCEGISLVVHGEHTDLLVGDNLIYEDIGAATQGCWGIGINAGYAETEGFVRAIVRGNTIRNMGNTGIGISSCVDCIVENKGIEHQQPFDMFGIFAPTGGAGANDLQMTRLTVRNNSIYTSNGDRIGIYVGGEGTGHVIVSNAIQADISSGSWACLSMPLPTNACAAIDNNIRGYAPASGREWEQGSGSIAAWRTASGFDLASQAVTPGFASPGAPGHNLSAHTAASALVDAGHPTRSAPRDLYGVLRSAPPDAGAHEFGVESTLFANGFEQAN